MKNIILFALAIMLMTLLLLGIVIRLMGAELVVEDGYVILRWQYSDEARDNIKPYIYPHPSTHPLY